MANVIYPMILFIFIFGAGMTYINETNLYSIKMPESGVTSELAQANATNTALLETTKYDSSTAYLQQLFILGKCVLGGIVAIFTLGVLLQNLGIPVGMVGFLISPLGVVLVFWLIEMWLGRSAE